MCVLQMKLLPPVIQKLQPEDKDRQIGLHTNTHTDRKTDRLN